MEKTEKELVRRNTSVKNNLKVDYKTVVNIEKFSKDARTIEKRLKKLDKEWDVERILEFNASVFVMTGIALSTRNRLALIIPAVVAGFLAQQALTGWCPPLAIMRRFGFRTRQEIDREKYALKALRGDFDNAWDVDDVWASVK